MFPNPTQKPADERPLARLLESVYDRLSQELAGGQRSHPDDLVPWASDPMEGSTPDDFIPEVDFSSWFDPTVWAGANPEEMGQIDLSSIPAASGPGKPGKGLDWFRTGEAPNNYTNRHNPLYVARREFAVAIAPELQRMFGVSVGGAGYMRPPHPDDAKPGGRSHNSDHYSGGALDITGDPAKLDQLRDWLIEQPWVSFVRWRSESHHDHLHVSIDIGWIAQNYFQGRQVPQMAPPRPQPAGQKPPSSNVLGRDPGGTNVPV